MTLPVWLLYLVLSEKARTGIWQKLGHYTTEQQQAFQHIRELNPKRPCVWFHAVSVGEFNAIRYLLDSLSRYPVSLCVSTTTRTGQALARKICPPEIPVFFFPFDLVPVIERTLAMVHPQLLVLTETELWPNVLDRVARWAGVPVLLINGRISPSSFRGYCWLKPLLAELLPCLSHAYMQSEKDAERLIQLGALPEKVTPVGNIKFDIPRQHQPDLLADYRQRFGIVPEDLVLICASTHEGEDALMLEAYTRLKTDFPELKLILAPRHPERSAKIQKLLNNRAIRFSLRSRLDEQHYSVASVILLDTIGELSVLYGLATLAVIGGSFIPKGGQNPLEALRQGVPVVFGPHMFNFSDISRLILEYHAGFQVNDLDDLVNTLTALLTQPEKYNNIVENGQHLLDANQGTRRFLLEAILSHLGLLDALPEAEKALTT
ncbi:MAG: 3-deoxy-D-manno-octulosonic acid transferase [Candidatus Melainabacteria bacterium]|nr:3-deoxy-D-manno-octulosonic acid transferase [Candidatus Melainabacteria bacterium]